MKTTEHELVPCEPSASRIDLDRADRLAHYMLRAINKANHRFGLLHEGDRVLVAVSGGKDSMTMLDLLYRYRRMAPAKYDLVVGRVRSDWRCGRAVPGSWLEGWCTDRGIALYQPEIAVRDDMRGGDLSPCFRCAWSRRKALFELADAVACNKVAFGHHADDAAETTLMNLFYSGKVRGLDPRLSLFEGRLIVIRPLALIEERDIVPFARAAGYPIVGDPCPDGQDSRRAAVKRMLRELERESNGIKRSIAAAVARCEALSEDRSTS